jgi:sterol desaturase/sphingolipid hydroxylase (fatty acid hydroxylase superfamily)
MIDYRTSNIADINPEKRIPPKESYFGEFHLHLFNSSILEAISLILAQKYITFAPSIPLVSENIPKLLVSTGLFIPMSVTFEVMFDFMHYWAHRIGHMNGFLYRYLHKQHHRYNYPSSIITFYQNPIDLVYNNYIPFLISLYLTNKMFDISLFQLSLLVIYKTYLEIAGHTGKDIAKVGCFPQMIWLPRLLGMDLYTIDHDHHHSKNNCNYSKRFSLWDKVFNTYYHPSPIEFIEE